MKIGLIGCGAIGRFLVWNMKKDIDWIVDSDPLAAKRLAAIGVKAAVQKTVPKGCGGADLVVEAASQQAVPLVEGCLEHCDVMVMSVGALVDDALMSRLVSAAEKHKRKIYLPAGAIGGLDAVAAVAGNASEVTLETVKPPASLGRSDSRRTVVYEGSAREAVKLFPKNVNISATLALAGIGFDQTVVRIISDPATDKNTHKVLVVSDAGRMTYEFENVPFEENPKTSKLAAMAALERIRRIGRTLQVG